MTNLLSRLMASPALLLLLVVGVVSVGAAVGSTGSGGVDRPAGPIAPRSGPSPGSSTVVESNPRPEPGEGVGSEPAAGSTGQPDRSEGTVAIEPPSTPFTETRDRATALVYATDFQELVFADWEIYDSPGHAGLGWRRPSAITIEPHPEAEGGSVLTITARMGTDDEEAGQIVSGGLALLRPKTYGTYTFRMRVDPDPARVTSGVAILWPWSNRWPEDGELDMVETWVNRDTRAPVETNIHYLDPFAQPPFEVADDRLWSIVHSGLDGSQWHTYRFDWRADRLTMAIDDGPARVVTDDPLHIPDWPMVPTFQLDAFPAPDGTRESAAVQGEVTLEVDWLVIEE